MKKNIFSLLLALCVFSLAQAQSQSQSNMAYVESLMADRTHTLAEIKKMADDHFAIVGTDRGSGYKHFMRWWYEQQFHLGDDGKILDPKVEQDAYDQALPKLSEHKTRNTWVELGPNTYNVTSSWNPGVGICNSLAPFPGNPNIIYAASQGGGIWKTTDGGYSWFPKTDAYPNSYQNVFWICVDPYNSDYVYAALIYGGVIKSTDGGNSWYTTGNGPYNTKRIIVNPDNTSDLLATADNGIFRSTDGGDNWLQVSTTEWMEDIAFQPGNSSIVYASGRGWTSFMRSTDGGWSWNTITSGITHTGRTLIGVSPDDANIVYLVQSNPSNHTFGRLYKSWDGGLNFYTTVVGGTSTTNYFGYLSDGSGTYGHAWWDMAIAVNPTNVEDVHIGGVICWRSTNGGYSFTATTEWYYPNNRGYNHADVHQLLYVGNRLYSATDGGISYSDNHADDWTNIWAGMGTKLVYRLNCAKTSSNTIAFGSQDNGQTYRLNGGAWNQWTGADGTDVAISSTNASYGIGMTQLGGMFRTWDGGGSYHAIPKPENAGNWVTPIVWHPTDGATVFTGYTGVYKSTNYGSSWFKISGNTINNMIECLAVAPSNANYIYASVGGTFYATTDGGASWNTYYPGYGDISSIAVHPSTPSKVYITTENTYNNVCVSTSSGNGFTSISNGLPGIAARTIAVSDDPVESIYVGMNVGVYRRNNLNTNWTVYGSGLPQVAINDLEINKGSNKLVVGTYGRGIWEVSLPASCGTPGSLVSYNVTSTTATVSWGAVSGGAQYVVEYKPNYASNWTVLGPTNGTSRNLTGLIAGTTYDWRVRTNCWGATSSYATAQFTTIGGCSSPTGLSANNTSFDAVTLQWSSVSNATGYTLQYRHVNETNLTTVTTTSPQYYLSGLAPGLYYWRVGTNCSNGNSPYSVIGTFNTYCGANSNPHSYWEYIGKVVCGTINRTSGDDGGYIFLDSPKPNIVKGATYYITLSAGFPFDMDYEHFKVYIDYNRNGDFDDPGETVASTVVNDDNDVTLAFTVPYSASLGSTIMRVQMKWGSPAYSACESFTNGEIEDYAINLTATPSMGNLESETQTQNIIKPGAMTVFPNPTLGDLNFMLDNVETEQVAQVEILTIDGRTIHRTEKKLEVGSNQVYSVSTEAVADGNYIIKVVTKEKPYFAQFTKY